MSSALRKLVAISGAVLIAAALTYYPWTYIDDFTGAASSFYGMSSILWAPTAAILGLIAGTLFAYSLWPRKLEK